MIASTLLISVFTFASLLATGSASDFLSKQLPTMEVEQALLDELDAMKMGAEYERILRIETELQPFFASMPKNAGGKIEPPIVRYVLHRYFAQKYGWHVRGLDAAGGSWNSSSPSSVMTNRVPGYMQNLFERTLHGEGMGLRDLSVFAATLMNLIKQETYSDVGDIFDLLTFSRRDSLPEDSMVTVLKMHSISLIRGIRASTHNIWEFEAAAIDLKKHCFIWDDIELWRGDLHETVRMTTKSQRNPFRQANSFSEVSAVVQEVTQRFASFQNLECRDLKSQLVEMGDKGTGRVPLASFYSGIMATTWPFVEGTAYLRSLGALDETDMKRPRVIIPNYMSSRTHCVSPSSFYAVCCLDECEGLLSRVERAIAHPEATPQRIAEVVSNLPSDTVEAPRNLSSIMVDRLRDIAAHHQGQVQLHGRLFAQWMHHAYPRECRYPHGVGSTVARSAKEWEEEFGSFMDVTDAEALGFIDAAVDEHPDDEIVMPWTHNEELIAPHVKVGSAYESGKNVCRWLALLVAFTAASWSMARSSKIVVDITSQSKMQYSV